MDADPKVKAFYEALVENKDEHNFIGTYTDVEGNTVVIVLNDDPDVLAPYMPRELGAAKFTVAREPFTAYEFNPNLRYRPAPGGVSVGHYNITAGTLGCYVRDKTDGSTCILSNAHVLADINAGSPPDAVLQPGPYHGGTVARDTIAHLKRSIKLHHTGPDNLVDAAIAEMINPADADLKIHDVGYVYGSVDAYIYQEVWKFGARTGLSRGTVLATDAVIEVGYGPNVSYVLHDCIISDIYSGPGDSGSAVVDFASDADVGELFAGGNGITIISKFSNIATLLNVETISIDEILRSFWTDVSHWNMPITSLEQVEESFNAGNFKANITGLNALSFSQMKSKRVRGVVCKSVQAPDIIDSEFDNYYAAIKAAALKFGTYIFVNPLYSAQQHFDLFLRAIGDKVLDIPVVMDCEVTGGQDKRTITAVYEGLVKLLTTWQGKRPIIYTSIGFWNANVLDSALLAECDLWDAYWSRVAITPDVPFTWVGHPEKVVMWQFWVNNNGKELGVGSAQCDTNLTFPAFEKYFDGITPPPPPDMVTLTVTVEGNGIVAPANGEFTKDSIIQLTATPAQGWKFDMWGGDIINQANPTSLLMDSAKNVTATFSEVSNAVAEFIHHKGKVIMSDGLNVRTKATTVGNTPIAKLSLGTIVNVLGYVEDAVGNTWGNIGYDYVRKTDLYAAVFYDYKKGNGLEEHLHILEEDEV